jgi:hypothetical protein
LESLLESGDNFVIAKAGRIALLQGIVDFFEDLVDLRRCGNGASQQDKQ